MATVILNNGDYLMTVSSYFILMEWVRAYRGVKTISNISYFKTINMIIFQTLVSIANEF